MENYTDDYQSIKFICDFEWRSLETMWMIKQDLQCGIVWNWHPHTGAKVLRPYWAVVKYGTLFLTNYVIRRKIR